MKKAQRGIYMELASEMDSTICCFCKYSQCIGSDSPCDCGEPSCEHPLKDRLEDSFKGYGIEPRQDCWGFRPVHPVDFCADITGICLANGWESATWWQNKKGIWRVAEVGF